MKGWREETKGVNRSGERKGSEEGLGKRGVAGKGKGKGQGEQCKVRRRGGKGGWERTKRKKKK